MRDITVYLCSSITEFERERKLISVYIHEIETKLREKGDVSLKVLRCEFSDNAMALGGLQRVYNKEIEESDLTVFLFGENAGEYTLQELDVAVAAHRKKAQPGDHILILCRHDPFRGPGGCALLKDKINRYRLDYSVFAETDTILLRILEKVVLLLQDNQ